jgi:putative redox protein
MIESSIGSEKYKVTHSNGRHIFYADEPKELGGGDKAASPEELLEASLASCTLATLRMYTDHKQWNVGEIKITVNLHHEEQANKIKRELKFEKTITEEQKTRLIQVAKACPVSKILSGISEMIVVISK